MRPAPAPPAPVVAAILFLGWTAGLMLVSLLLPGIRDHRARRELVLTVAFGCGIFAATGLAIILFVRRLRLG